MQDTQAAKQYPVLPLRDIVVFPHMIVPLFVGRERSVKALDEAMHYEKQILLVTQKNASQDDPTPEDIYRVGVLGTVLQVLNLPDRTVKVLVEGGERMALEEFVDGGPCFQASASRIEEIREADSDVDALARTTLRQFERYIKLDKNTPSEVVVSLNQIEEPGKLADTIASHLSLGIAERQDILETAAIGRRLEKIYAVMESEIGVLQVEKRIRNRVKKQMEKTQREYYLNEQLKAIRKELGEGEEGQDELQELEDRIARAKLSKEAREK
ncbi:LON peptidase substrate-binding domain-containing protein, partial [Ferruginivarius sediminum]